MVEVRYSDRLGNWLFQYCLGRILAEGLGYALSANAIEGFPRTREKVAGKTYLEPIDRYVRHAISMESILLDPRPRRVVLEGWFQNYRYYAPHADQMREWLAWQTPDSPATVPLLDDEDHSEDLLLHVRLGDLVAKQQAISIDYYLTLLQRIPHRHAYLAAENNDDRLLRPLIKAGIRLLPASLGAAGTIRSANQFGKLGISQATFGWWMAFLGTAINNVHVAIPEHKLVGSGSLSRIADGLDLRIDERRYTYYYRTPLIGEKREGRLTELGNFCGAHVQSKAFAWN